MLISVPHCASGCDVTTREPATEDPDRAETAGMSAPSALKTQPWRGLKPRKEHGHSWSRLALTPALLPPTNLTPGKVREMPLETRVVGLCCVWRACVPARAEAGHARSALEVPIGPHTQAPCFWVSHLRGGGAGQAGHRDSLVPTEPEPSSDR